MKTSLLFLALLASLAACAQSSVDYDVVCTEVGAKLTTPTDSIGVVIDSAEVASRIADVDAQLERISLDEIELALRREKRDALATKDILVDIQRRAREVCDETSLATPQ